MTYLALDGDHVGAHLERFLLDNDAAGAKTFSRRLTACVTGLAQDLAETGCSIVFQGGDSILARTDDLGSADLTRLTERDGIGFSVGTGDSCRDAYLALKYAKANGRRCAVTYADGTFSVLPTPDKAVR